MCLVSVSEAGYGASNGGLGEVPLVAALAVLPLLYVLPATRPLWLRHRYPLLAVQAALTYVPFAFFGTNWAPSGWLAGLVLLTVPSPASWFVAAILAALEEAVWAGALGVPYQPAALWAMFAFVFDAMILFGLARLADLVTAVHEARDELAEAAVTAERVRAADSLRAAIGDRLAPADHVRVPRRVGPLAHPGHAGLGRVRGGDRQRSRAGGGEAAAGGDRL